MKLEEYVDYLVEFLKEKKEETGANGFVVGLSGGIDSALVAALIKKACPDDCCAIIIPIHSDKKDLSDALEVAESLHIPFEIVDLSASYDMIASAIGEKNKEYNSLAYANTKVRLRMTTLYAVAQLKGYLVVGTDNACEYYTGYFTKHGDGAYDILPTRYLVKEEVRKAARYLGISEKIINKTPTAGLINGVTDELEMGVKYDELDAYLLGKEISESSKKRIEHLHKVSEHKRNLAIMPKEFER